MLVQTGISCILEKGIGPRSMPMMNGSKARASVPGPTLRKVLVVDDERDLADLAEALLCSAGLDVKVAYCALDALQILASDPDIDALFSDVMMPGMTGLELASAVSALYPRIKIVLTSGYTLPALLAAHERPFLYASKPYRLETVLELLRGPNAS